MLPQPVTKPVLPVISRFFEGRQIGKMYLFKEKLLRFGTKYCYLLKSIGDSSLMRAISLSKDM